MTINLQRHQLVWNSKDNLHQWFEQTRTKIIMNVNQMY